MPKSKKTKAKTTSSKTAARRSTAPVAVSKRPSAAAARASRATKPKERKPASKAATPARRSALLKKATAASKASKAKTTKASATAKKAATAAKPSRQVSKAVAKSATRKSLVSSKLKARSERAAAPAKAASSRKQTPALPKAKKAKAPETILKPISKATRAAAAELKAPTRAPSKPILIGDVVKARPTRGPAEASSPPPEPRTPAPAAPKAAAINVKRAAPRGEPGEQVLAEVRALAEQLGAQGLERDLAKLVEAAISGHDALGFVRDNDDAAFIALAAAPHIVEPSLFISPSAAVLRALEERAGKLGLCSVRLDASSTPTERGRALGRIAKGGPLLALVDAAELRTREFAQACARVGIGLVVIDDAHVASAFGHEIRPSVAELGAVLGRLGEPPVVALTRPIAAAARDDLIERLHLREPVVVELPLVRGEVALTSYVVRGEARQTRLAEIVQKLAAPGVIFCAQPHDVDRVYGGLTALGLEAHRHHSGLAPQERARELEAWADPARRSILVTTSGLANPSGVLGLGDDDDPKLVSFGRFVPRRDVRFVLHYQAPASLDQYVREVALAGRDGAPAEAVLLYDSAHRSLNDALLAQQRLRPQNLLALSSALEAATHDNKPLTVEALALSSGQSRRTMERLTALLVDAGLVEKVAGKVLPIASAAELAEACQRLSARFEALRVQDAFRLEAVTAYAESDICRYEALCSAFGVSASACGRCSVCAPRPFEGVSRDVGAIPVRRPAAQSFSAGAPPASSGSGASTAGSSPVVISLKESKGR